MAFLKRNIMCNEVTNSHIEKIVTVNGWVNKKRSMSGRYFIDLRDVTGIVQLVIDQEKTPELFEITKDIKNEYVIAAKGKVITRQSINKDLENGDIEIDVEQLEILSKSDVLPFQLNDDTVSESLRYKHRYIDLRSDRNKNMLITRNNLLNIVRNYLWDNNFIEFDTPTLVKSTPEGARDYLVASRLYPGEFYALPQSPQSYKQMLMISGFDKYFQICRCYRDEDTRADRQPEFSQIDIEMSFVDQEDVINMTEGLVKKIFKNIKNVDLPENFRRMSCEEAMRRYGCDKPDTRFGLELISFNDDFENSDFGVFSENIKNGGSVKGINANGLSSSISSKGFKNLEKMVKTFGAKGLAFIRFENGEVNSPIAKFLSEETIENIKKKADVKDGDILFFISDKDDVVTTALSNLRIHLGKTFNLYDKESFDVLWVVDMPMFEYSEEEDRYVAKHHPFTAPSDNYKENFEENMDDAIAIAYDLIINGYEAAGGSIRINTQDVQKRMFNALKISDEEAQIKFDFLLEALKYGTPPHGGIAFGVERMAMILCNTNNIKDVIAFPKANNARCPLTGAPTLVTQEQLEEIHLKVNE